MHIKFYKKSYTKMYIRRPRKEDNSMVVEEISHKMGLTGSQ